VEETKENGVAFEAASGSAAAVADDTMVIIERRRNLFDLLCTETLLLVFHYIGTEDKKSYVKLAASSDRDLVDFIYTGCTSYLWRNLDLQEYPGIMDSQLKSLLERINGQSITTNIVLDKTSDTTITGSGLEPLRGSKVLESIDLRQSLSLNRGPTSLVDELVADILSTMIPHALETVKVRKQYYRSSDGVLFDEYCLLSVELLLCQICT
jgi:hypothetical protein